MKTLNFNIGGISEAMVFTLLDEALKIADASKNAARFRDEFSRYGEPIIESTGRGYIIKIGFHNKIEMALYVASIRV